ncbi:hypothetical protein, variant 1 [Aphanomyces invadans]|uniref:PX domain-containing protein n=1 Tax=Aphanomyces invadans TaxID=157072 RepID=A0A024TKW8_9STRA|nr:hypothetical protein, variant 1 [Aphanomyces invadans]ETV94688.1 hypothetical protein, variant 1 [Aphanomyces invadans]|eukprot:XP_008876632.1 hypothetical protein, variant 1 [Aphanomyces invadans]
MQDFSDNESSRRDARTFKSLGKMSDENAYAFSIDGDNAASSRRGVQLTCRIVSHTIDKQETRKFRRSIHTRPYFVTFIMHVTDADDVSTVKRTYLQFKSFHKQLCNKYPRANILPLPSMKLNRYDSRYIEQKYKELERYVEHLFALDTIASCDLLRAFLDDCPLSDGTDDDENDHDDVNEIRESTTVLIQRGQSYSISVEIPCAGADVAFQFSAHKYDVGFTIILNHDHVLHMYSREQTLRGTVTCPSSGVCVLTWDNSYVWRRSKTITYRADVILPFNHASANGSSTDPVEQSTAALPPPTGYIEQVRSHSMIISPRRLVSRSMTKIGWANGSGAYCIKAGALIVQRRHTLIKAGFTSTYKWYRKWFTLDGAHGILRYYDKEEAVAREGAIAKLRVSSAKTTLDVPPEHNSPTPYAFRISSGKITWSLCAENEEEFVAWRAALATCMYFERWNQTSMNHEAECVTQLPLSPSSDEDLSDDDDECECDDDDELSPLPHDHDRPSSPDESPAPRSCPTCQRSPQSMPTSTTTEDDSPSSPLFPTKYDGGDGLSKQHLMQFVTLNGTMAMVVLAPSVVIWTFLVIVNTVVMCRIINL